MTIVVGEDIEQALLETAAWVDDSLRRRLARCQGASPRLAESMRYSIMAGGKRLRPALVLWCCEACDGRQADALPAALAVECVHTFSLIHDDLPALDNDDLRRGRAANHKKFGEATAILAGDGLLALAFEILARDVADPALVAAMVAELAAAAGWEGMIGGEAADLEGEALPPNAGLVARIHADKTARLIQAACRLGALAARADDASVSDLARYGHELGLAFQAVDDLLDATATARQLGKNTGKDASSGKQTYLRAVGMEEGRRIAKVSVDQAVAALARFGSNAAKLASLARYVLERQS